MKIRDRYAVTRTAGAHCKAPFHWLKVRAFCLTANAADGKFSGSVRLCERMLNDLELNGLDFRPISQIGEGYNGAYFHISMNLYLYLGCRSRCSARTFLVLTRSLAKGPASPYRMFHSN